MKRKLSIKVVLLIELVIFLIIFALNVLVCSGTEGLSRVGNFIDMPSIICILLVVIPVLWVSGMGRDFLNSFSVGQKEYTLSQLKRILESIIMVQRLIVCGAGITAVIGIITILTRLDHLETMGANLAVVLLVVFYTVVLELFLITLRANTQNVITDMMDSENEEA